MIKQIFDISPQMVTDSYYGKKILAAFYAYGGDYDFCRFYSCGSGLIHVYNASMIIDGDPDISDVEMFIRMTKPAAVEVKSNIALQIGSAYKEVRRTLFRVKSAESGINLDNVKVNSCTDKCFAVLGESFDKMLSYDDWYVDISHRIRHNVSKLYWYDSTTVTQQFNINGFVFLSHIATAPCARGRGTARKLLWLIGSEAEKNGETAYLFALDNRRSFYETIGFKSVGEDILYEMKG